MLFLLRQHTKIVGIRKTVTFFMHYSLFSDLQINNGSLISSYYGALRPCQSIRSAAACLVCVFFHTYMYANSASSDEACWMQNLTRVFAGCLVLSQELISIMGPRLLEEESRCVFDDIR